MRAFFGVGSQEIQFALYISQITDDLGLMPLTRVAVLCY